MSFYSEPYSPHATHVYIAGYVAAPNGPYTSMASIGLEETAKQANTTEGLWGYRDIGKDDIRHYILHSYIGFSNDKAIGSWQPCMDSLINQ